MSFLNIFLLLMLTGLDISQVNAQDLEIVSVRSNQLPGRVIGHFFFYFLGESTPHLKR